MLAKRFGRGTLVLIAGLLLATYAGSYRYLARRGQVYCDSTGGSGFLYVLPHDSAHWPELHECCVAFYGPANWADRNLGAKRRYPARCVGFGLSKD